MLKIEVRHNVSAIYSLFSMCLSSFSNRNEINLEPGVTFNNTSREVNSVQIEDLGGQFT